MSFLDFFQWTSVCLSLEVKKKTTNQQSLPWDVHMSFLPFFFKVEIVFPKIVCVRSVPSDSGNLCYECSALSSGIWLNVIWLRCSTGDNLDIDIHMYRYIHVHFASPLFIAGKTITEV